MTKNHGFTLIELIVTVAVIAIVLLTGIPALNSMVGSNRLSAHVNSISGSLVLARSEAIRRGSSITLCGSNDGTTCNTSNWEEGWIVFTDADNSGTINGTDVLLKAENQLPGDITLRLSQSDNAGMMRYKSSGALRDLNADATNTDKGTFTLCDKDADATKAKAINVNIMGRVSLAEDTDTTKDKIVNDINGNNVTCP